MERLEIDIDPYVNDIGHLGVSLINVAEVMLPCLDAVGARSVIEVGAYAGDLTALLLEWAEGSEARIVAIDPSPQPELAALDEARADLQLVRDTSLHALGRIELPDAVVIDGDHNYYTVSEELRLLGGRAESGQLPLLLFHDVSWPHARRDDYFDPDLIPEGARRPTARDEAVFPGEPGTRTEGGIRYRWPAAREGGPRNGVLTAVDDFVAAQDGLRLAVVPAFFGFGVVWDESAPWADSLAAVLEPWDGNALLARLEANRVFHLATAHGRRREVAELQRRAAVKEEALRTLRETRSYALARRLVHLRRRIRRR